jgi:glutamine phosphoribosylpyrophosphate amidotransferase
MTQDEIIEMARQAGATEIGHKPPAFHFYLKDLQAFAKLVAAKEREACAKVCEDENHCNECGGGVYHAELIRQRG